MGGEDAQDSQLIPQKREWTRDAFYVVVDAVVTSMNTLDRIRTFSVIQPLSPSNFSTLLETYR